MMRRTEITVETDRLILINRRSSKTQWCDSCEGNVAMLTIDEAAIAARVNSRTIFGWADSGSVHSTETAQGLLLICPHSLRKN